MLQKWDAWEAYSIEHPGLGLSSGLDLRFMSLRPMSSGPHPALGMEPT